MTTTDVMQDDDAKKGPDEPVWTSIGIKLRRELRFRDDVTREDERSRNITRVWTHEGKEVRWDNRVEIKQGFAAEIFGRM